MQSCEQDQFFHAAYLPTVEFVHQQQASFNNPPLTQLRQFREQVVHHYDTTLIDRLQEDRYDPIIIAYDHTHFEELQSIQDKIASLVAQSPKPITILHEIDPERLEEIKAEVNPRTIYPSYKTFNDERLARWFVHNGIEVASIEHPQALWWPMDDEDANPGIDAMVRADLTAIKRDQYGLQRIAAVRPDVISVGTWHGLKYDVLLKRTGETSFYFLHKPFDWERILSHWQQAHTLYTDQQEVSDAW